MKKLIDQNFNNYDFLRFEKDENLRYRFVDGVKDEEKLEHAKNMLSTDEFPLIQDIELFEAELPNKDGKLETMTMARTLLNKDLIDTFNPDKIDNKYFWKQAIKFFPNLSNCGGYYPSHKPEDVILSTHHHTGALMTLEQEFSKNKDFKMLEIGAGIGAIPKAFEKYVTGFMKKNYWGIDYIKQFECSTLYMCDGKTFPKRISKDLDVVYAINVFQHLTPNQRFSYYKEAYEHLKTGGCMIVGQFLLHNDEDQYYWSAYDKDNNYYCHFFNQLTRCETLFEFAENIRSIGYDHMELLKKSNNMYVYKLVK